MDDLVRYANREDIDPITQAAVAHAQFETIHPYADGNGRIGRVLVGWLLAR
jgi:Fic family protein